MPDFTDEIRDQFRHVRMIASRGAWNVLGINELLNSLFALHKLLTDYYDPPYRQVKSEVGIRYAAIYSSPNDDEFITGALGIAMYWLGGISALLGRKGFMSGDRTLVTEDVVAERPEVENPNFADDDPQPGTAEGE
jgi:hypothetical protein